jgi:hypothetical protein
MGFAAIPNSKFDNPVTFTPREVYNKVFYQLSAKTDKISPVTVLRPLKNMLNGKQNVT